MQSAATAPATLVTRPHCTNSVYPPSYQPPGSEMCSTKAVRATAGDQPSSRAKAANAAPGARKSPMIARVCAALGRQRSQRQAAHHDLEPGLAKGIELDRVTSLVLTDPAQHVAGCQLSPERSPRAPHERGGRHWQRYWGDERSRPEVSTSAESAKTPMRTATYRATSPNANPQIQRVARRFRMFDRRSHLRRCVSR